jgi:hypothetical protein
MLINELVSVVAENLGEREDPPLAVFPAAIPYFSVRVTAICVEKRELDVFREYILRAVQLGFQKEMQVAEFLGASTDEIVLELKNLREELFVSTSANGWILTEKGVQMLSATGLQRTTQREGACIINGVTRKPEPTTQSLVPRRKLPQGTLALPAMPARPPKLADINVSGVRSAMILGKGGLPRVLEVSRLGKITRTTSLFLSGHLLLRRGRHGVPIVCAQRSPMSELAGELGGHPAIRSLKSQVDGDEKRARALIRKFFKMGVNVKVTPTASLKTALSALQLWAGAKPDDLRDCEQALRDALASLSVGGAHWISIVEWQLLLVQAMLFARSRIVIRVPSPSPVFQRRSLAELARALQRGVECELILNPSDVQVFERDEVLVDALRGKVKIQVADTLADNVGFCVDDSQLVVGVCKESTSTMGTHYTLFGAHLPQLDDAAKAFTHFAFS